MYPLLSKNCRTLIVTISIVPGFLLCRFTNSGNLNTRFETERIVFYEPTQPHNNYLPTIKKLVDAVYKLGTVKLEVNERNVTSLDTMWRMLECPNTYKVTKKFLSELQVIGKREEVEIFIQNYLTELTLCVNSAEKYLQQP